MSENEELKEQPVLDQNIDVVSACIVHDALNDAYVGGSERRDPLTEAELNNLYQSERRYAQDQMSLAFPASSSSSSSSSISYHTDSGVYADGIHHEHDLTEIYNNREQGELLRVIQERSRRNILYNEGPEREYLNDNEERQNAKQRLAHRNRNLLPDQIEEKRIKKNEAGRIYRQKIKMEKARLSDERLNVGTTNTRPTPTTTTTTTSQPPGGQLPGTIQGQPRYAPKKEAIKQRRQDSEIKIDEANYYKTQKRFNKTELREKIEEFTSRIGNVGALGEQLIDQYGGMEAYLSTIMGHIEAGLEPEDILNQSLEGLQQAIMEKQDQFEIDRDEFKHAIDPNDYMTDDKFEELYNMASETLGDNNRSDDRMDLPDQGGAPLSSSTGTNTDDIYVDPGVFDPYSNPPPPNDPRGGDPTGGNNIFNAMYNLHLKAPHVAAMMSDPSTRSIIIKKKRIKSIYPPDNKHTNLDIVQQSIARFNYDSNLLNVYFS
jgi:hypothetical protein